MHEPKIERVRATLGKNIRHFRRAQGLSQHAVSARAGLYPRHVQKVESGQCNATVDTLTPIAVALRIEVGALFTSPRWSALDAIERRDP
jgi:transcriptional regulator with XRE-family HTH domain